jgi:pyruvate/2-oxoglutarate dehydrogenase complex dihydrolipoamide dehydrogenase (E3) component
LAQILLIGSFSPSLYQKSKCFALSDTFLALRKLPSSAVSVGSGIIGVEFAAPLSS